MTRRQKLRVEDAGRVAEPHAGRAALAGLVTRAVQHTNQVALGARRRVFQDPVATVEPHWIVRDALARDPGRAKLKFAVSQPAENPIQRRHVEQNSGVGPSVKAGLLEELAWLNQLAVEPVRLWVPGERQLQHHGRADQKIQTAVKCKRCEHGGEVLSM